MALLGYIGFEYENINYNLREGNYNSDTEQVKILRNAISKIPTYQGEVYRYAYFSLDFLEEFIQKIITTGQFAELGFMSSSKRKNALDIVENPNIKYIIQSKTGHDLRGINDSEKEDNTKFDIIKIEENNGIFELTMKESEKDDE